MPSALRQFTPGKFGKFGLTALFVSRAFIVRVAEAADDQEAQKKKISVRGGSVAINQCSLRKSTSRVQVFKTVAFSINFIRGS